jgi:hypothetical protein
VRRCAAAATTVGNHSFQEFGITTYLKNGGVLEKAVQMTRRANARTTQLNNHGARNSASTRV